MERREESYILNGVMRMDITWEGKVWVAQEEVG